MTGHPGVVESARQRSHRGAPPRGPSIPTGRKRLIHQYAIGLAEHQATGVDLGHEGEIIVAITTDVPRRLSSDEQPQEAARQRWIDVAGGSSRKQVGPQDQRGGNRRALLLPSRQDRRQTCMALARPTLAEVRQPRRGSSLPPGPRPQRQGPFSNVVRWFSRRKVLEHDPHATAQFVGRFSRCGSPFAENRDEAARRFGRPGDRRSRVVLPAPYGPFQELEGAWLDREGQIPQTSGSTP